MSGPKITWFWWAGLKRCTVHRLHPTRCSKDGLTRLIDVALLNCWSELFSFIRFVMLVWYNPVVCICTPYPVGCGSAGLSAATENRTAAAAVMLFYL